MSGKKWRYHHGTNPLPKTASPQPVESVAPQPVTTAPAQSSAKPAATPEVQRTTPASGIFSTEGVEVKEMDRVRKVIADHMVTPKYIPRTVTRMLWEVDVTKLVKWRYKNKDAFCCEGVKLTFV